MNVVIHKNGVERLVPVKLPDPKEGQLKTYMIDELNFTVNEVTKYHDNYRSWFADDMLSKQGSIYMVTPVDSLFILLPTVMKFRSSYRSLQDIITTDEQSQSLMCVLSPIIKWNNICDTQQIDDELFIRYNEQKTLDWLAGKFEKSCLALRQDIGPLASQSTVRSYAFDWICQYIPEDLGRIFREKHDTTGGKREEPEVRNDLKSTTKNSSHTPSKTAQRASKRTPSKQSSVGASGVGGSASPSYDASSNKFKQTLANNHHSNSNSNDKLPSAPKEDRTNRKLTDWLTKGKNSSGLGTTASPPPNKRLRES